MGYFSCAIYHRIVQNIPEIWLSRKLSIGWIACYPKSRLAGTLFCGGIGEPKAIEGNEMLQKAFELGKSV